MTIYPIYVSRYSRQAAICELFRWQVVVKNENNSRHQVVMSANNMRLLPCNNLVSSRNNRYSRQAREPCRRHEASAFTFFLLQLFEGFTCLVSSLICSRGVGSPMIDYIHLTQVQTAQQKHWHLNGRHWIRNRAFIWKR